ncbi:hypothetical protein [Devosia submarina]|uniref:hypothetical protein n=1 Tax=Devosia submarina TaxID=1173082 RepID=UPI000D3CD538|nr:hypothetical protein [Devosia submarina]
MALSLLISGLSLPLLGCQQGPRAVLSREEAEALYLQPPARPGGKQSVFHLGHSLVGRDMPAMLAQLAGTGHVSQSQLGWGASLKAHWHDEVAGFAEENAHPAARPVFEAIDSGGYDAVVFTEMVEIKDAIRYQQSADYLHRWAGRAREANPNVALYLYESWHNINDTEGWLLRIERDLARYWENEILLPAVRADAGPIYVIPGGQALAATIKAVMARGGVDGVWRIEDFFALAADGSQDTIHPNDLGAYVIALTHYAVLYQADPRGLPHELRRADGSKAMAPGPALAELIQEAVWASVTGYDKTGVRA